MNTEETIAAAIEKLETEREAATPGPWSSRDERARGGGMLLLGAPAPCEKCESSHDDVINYSTYDRAGDDAHLIVTLHRSIPALLGLLRVAVNNPGCETDEEVALANAILGERP